MEKKPTDFADFLQLYGEESSFVVRLRGRGADDPLIPLPHPGRKNHRTQTPRLPAWVGFDRRTSGGSGAWGTSAPELQEELTVATAGDLIIKPLRRMARGKG